MRSAHYNAPNSLFFWVLAHYNALRYDQRTPSKRSLMAWQDTCQPQPESENLLNPRESLRHWLARLSLVCLMRTGLGLDSSQSDSLYGL
jgi:hypothetical protein